VEGGVKGRSGKLVVFYGAVSDIFDQINKQQILKCYSPSCTEEKCVIKRHRSYFNETDWQSGSKLYLMNWRKAKRKRAKTEKT